MMSKPSADVLRPMRVDREFADFLKQTKNELSKKLSMDTIRIPNTIATKQIVKWAKIGRYYDNKSSCDPVARAMNKLMK
jgi:hypothetical protein